MKQQDLDICQRRLNYYQHFFIEKLENPVIVWQAIYTHRYTSVVTCGITKSDVIQYEQDCTQQETPTSEFIFAQLLSSSPKIRSILSVSLQDLIQILQVTGNRILATILSIDPSSISIGSLNWDKIIFDLWDDLLQLNYSELSAFLLHSKAILPLEHERILQFSHNSERLVQLICLLAHRYKNLDILQQALYFLGTVSPFYLTIANKCTNIDIDEFEWMQWHRDIFIFLAKQLDHIVLVLKKRAFLTSLDLTRLDRLKTEPLKAKYIFDTLQRKNGPMYSLITACERSFNEDLAYIMKLQPIDIQIPWHAFQLIQFNWMELIQINYERIAIYLVSKNFVRYKEHVQCKMMGNNQDKMRFILKLVLTRGEDFYDAFFHILSLLKGHQELFQNCYPMCFEEKKIILECQDFLAQQIKYTDHVCEQLGEIGLLTTSDSDYIYKMPSVLTRNLAICNIMKTKSVGTVFKLRNVLWKTKNRNCAEILAVDFQNFQMTIEEWNKLKANFVEIVKIINLDSVSVTLLNTGVISEEENQWIEKSPKNRHRMRKLLRILPTKKRGFKILLLAISQYDDYQNLLLKCQPMDLWQLKRLSENIEFLTNNTENLTLILQEMLSRNILTDNEAKLITYYEEPVQELYMTLMGKDNGIWEHLVEILEKTDNPDAAAILTIDLFSIKMTTIEWNDYQRLWLDFQDEIQYTEIRECLLSSGLISSIEDHACMTSEKNEIRMRLLLQIVPYRQGGFQALVQLML